MCWRRGSCLGVLKMALTKSDIFGRVQNMLGDHARHVHDIDDELLYILQDISALGDFLPTSDSSLSTTASTAIVDVSSLLIKTISEVWVSGDKHLDRGSKSDYLDSIEDSSSPTTGEPSKWFLWGTNLYVYDYVPNDTYTLQIEYYKYHANSVDTIEFPDRFRRMIVDGVLKDLWRGVLENAIENKDYANLQYERYLRSYMHDLDKHKSLTPTEVFQIRYRDV